MKRNSSVFVIAFAAIVLSTQTGVSQEYVASPSDLPAKGQGFGWTRINVSDDSVPAASVANNPPPLAPPAEKPDTALSKMLLSTEGYFKNAFTSSSNTAADQGCAAPANGSPFYQQGMAAPNYCECTGPSFWGGLEYLLVFPKGRSVPPLVTTSTNPGGAANPGAIGDPSTNILFGGQNIGRALKSGGRATAGFWTDETRTIGFGGRLFGLSNDRTNLFADSNGTPFLTVPFSDANPGFPGPTTAIIANPGISTGNLSVRTTNNIYAAEAFGRFNLQRTVDYRIDMIAGYHYTLIDDRLALDTFSSGLGTTFALSDRFKTHNEFHGGELGLMGDWGIGPWKLNAMGKASIGSMLERVTINGQYATTGIALPQPAGAGGIFAQPTNIGSYHRSMTTCIPEASINLTRKLTPNFDFTFGYSFIYWNNIVLAGNQIDTTVNSSQTLGGTLTGPSRPSFQWVSSDYWLHSISFGATYRF